LKGTRRKRPGPWPCLVEAQTYKQVVDIHKGVGVAKLGCESVANARYRLDN